MTGEGGSAAMADEVRHIDALSRPPGPRRRALKTDGLHGLPEVVTHRRVGHDLVARIGPDADLSDG
jgi:hypothetical protein